MVNGHERYYKIISAVNLFGEHYVSREYGNTNYKRPTRVIENKFETLSEATKFVEIIKSQKLHRGYMKKCA